MLGEFLEIAFKRPQIKIKKIKYPKPASSLGYNMFKYLTNSIENSARHRLTLTPPFKKIMHGSLSTYPWCFQN